MTRMQHRARRGMCVIALAAAVGASAAEDTDRAADVDLDRIRGLIEIKKREVTALEEAAERFDFTLQVAMSSPQMLDFSTRYHYPAPRSLGVVS